MVSALGALEVFMARGRVEGLKQQELDDLALSLAVRNNWSPERIVEAKERVRVKKTALEVAFDRARDKERPKRERL
jgi:hypothetical protein